jgi:pyruvate-formate lyase
MPQNEAFRRHWGAPPRGRGGPGKVGGTCIQLNVTDANTLRESQKHPDEYRNLLVPVTAYSAYFVGLGKEIPDEIITRESHQLG